MEHFFGHTTNIYLALIVVLLRYNKSQQKWYFLTPYRDMGLL